VKGNELYEMFQDANAKYGERKPSWMQIEPWKQKVWDDLAAKVVDKLEEPNL
jgi:hypothetical protein